MQSEAVNLISYNLYCLTNVKVAVLQCSGAQCDIVLVARSQDGLEDTKARIMDMAQGVTPHVIQADLGQLASLQDVFSRAAKIADGSKHQQYVLVNNAGTLGDVSKPMIQLSDPEMLQDYLGLNFTSVFILTAHFLSAFKSDHRTVINITTLAARVYMPSLSLYSASRAAREAYMGVLAVENPDVRVLNYSPGPCNTDMHRAIAEESFSGSLAQQFQDNYTNKVVLSCSESISKLVGLLQEDKFENGGIVDYFDLVASP